MTLLTLLFSVIIWGIVFYLFWWAIGALALPEPFSKIATVILVLASLIVVVGLLMGNIAPFPFLAIR